MPEVVCVIPARNEEKFLAKSLGSVLNQGPDEIIVVDDHSNDKTAEIARRSGVTVLPGPEHKFSTRSLRICETINEGLRHVPSSADYVAIIGADVILCDNWLKYLVDKMESDPRIVVASGRVEGSIVNVGMPRGTRLVNYSWWKEELNGYYPEIPGWESYLVFWALANGKKVGQFPEVHVTAQRKVGSEWDWTENGDGLRVNGYNLFQVLLRSLRLTLRGDILPASRSFAAYLQSRYRPERWIWKYQKKRTIRLISHFASFRSLEPE